MSEPLRHYRLTAVGPAALGSIRIEGRGARRWLERHLRSRRGTEIRCVPDHIRLALFPLGDDPATAEQLVVCALDHDTVELHSHGGAALAAVSRRLAELGCPAHDPHEARWWPEDSKASVAAWQVLPMARSVRSAAILLDQARGRLDEEVGRIIEALRGGEIERAERSLAALHASHAVGRHLTRPFEIVLAGRPNSGKSSLFNRLLGYRRALVDSLPGTTRDVLEAETAFDGWSVRLVDTAGRRRADAGPEAAGIALGVARAERADLGLWLVDGSRPAEGGTSRPPGAHGAQTRWLVVHNKCDLGIHATHEDVRLAVSARDGTGVDRLVAAIVGMLVPHPPSPGAPVLFAADQFDAVRAAREAVRRGEHAEAVRCLLTSFSCGAKRPEQRPAARRGRGRGSN